jgi:tRNA pseudouridine38-40 synthase
MRRVAVKIAYLGELFAGSQIQPGERTVEGDVMKDLKKICTLDENAIDLKCASRTDRGVNALGNVIVFHTSFADNAALLKALNAVSDGVFYRAAADVDEKFNPRHANERIYRYILPKAGMKTNAVKKCASLFVGEHDFARFCKQDDRNTIMEMRSVSVDDLGDAFMIEFRADHFLWNQIRRITAAISSVGRGSSTLEEVKQALKLEEITFGIARSDALTLYDVVYNDIQFKNAASIGSRVAEGRFSASLKKMFYDSL